MHEVHLAFNASEVLFTFLQLLHCSSWIQPLWGLLRKKTVLCSGSDWKVLFYSKSALCASCNRSWNIPENQEGVLVPSPPHTLLWLISVLNPWWGWCCCVTLKIRDVHGQSQVLHDLLLCGADDSPRTFHKISRSGCCHGEQKFKSGLAGWLDSADWCTSTQKVGTLCL